MSSETAIKVLLAVMALQLGINAGLITGIAARWPARLRRWPWARDPQRSSRP